MNFSGNTSFLLNSNHSWFRLPPSLKNFVLFCLFYSVTHATVDAVLAFSSAEIGVGVGSMSGFVLYIFYTFSALLLAKPFLNSYGPKKGVFYGLVGMVSYVAAFYLAILMPSVAEPIFLLGAALGGIGAGILWTSQGSYYSINANQHSLKTGQDPLKVSTTFAAIFAIFYLSFETGFKLIATFIFLADSHDSTDGLALWRILVFGLYTLAAFVSVILFVYCTDDMAESLDTEDSDEIFEVHFNSDLVTSAKSSTPTCLTVLSDAMAVMKALSSIRNLQLMMPYQICFGLSSGFVNTYIFGVIVSESLGDGYIGLLSGLSILAAVMLAYPMAYVANNVAHGTYYVMIVGGLCFVCAGLPLLFLSNETIGSWSFIVGYCLIHGVARGVWENTNKAVIAEYFNRSKDRDAAFAAIYFTSGLAGACGFLVFQFMSRNQLAILNICASVLAIVSYHLSYQLYSGSSERTHAPLDDMSVRGSSGSGLDGEEGVVSDIHIVNQRNYNAKKSSDYSELSSKE